MTKLESGDLWHRLSAKYQARQGGDFQLPHRFGFDPSRLTRQELVHYCMVYMATMAARGCAQRLDKDLQGALDAKTKTTTARRVS